MQLLNHEFISSDTVSLSVFHKEYCICVHTADRLVEASLYNEGLNFYKSGENLAYTYLIYNCLPVFCDVRTYEDYQKAFVKLFYTRDKESIDSFYSIVESLIESCKSDQLKIALLPILGSRELIDQILDGWDVYNFDSTLSSFINQVDYWGRKTSEKFDAFVDDSKPLMHFRDYSRMVQSINLEIEIGTDRRTLQLPLKLNEIIFTNFKDNTVVQIADLIAGAANHYFRTLTSQVTNDNYSDDLAKKIGASKIVNLVTNAVWPHQAITPEDLGTVDDGRINALDAVAALTWKHT